VYLRSLPPLLLLLLLDLEVVVFVGVVSGTPVRFPH
jgi:hypothetical protein